MENYSRKYVTMNVADIKPYPNNPRINDAAVENVKKSIEQCGYVAPIIVDENKEILAGHTRLKALQQLDRKTAQVVIIKGMTDEQKRKYRLLDNKTGEAADWDFDLLLDELEGLDFEDMDLDWGIDLEAEPEDLEKEETENSGVLLTINLPDIDTWNAIENELKAMIDEQGGTIAVKMQ